MQANDSDATLSRRRFLHSLMSGGALAVLAACGTQQSTAPTVAPTTAPTNSTAPTVAPANTPTTAATTQPPATGTGLSGEVNLRYFPFGTGVEELYGQFAKEFEEKNPGVKINLDLQPWDNRYPKMLADIAAGQGPDVMFITTDVLIRFVKADALRPLDDLVSPAAWEGYSEDMLNEISYEGKRWYTPMDQEVPVWIANTALLEKAGMAASDLPSTWDDIRNICRKVQALGEAGLWGWGYNAAAATLNTTFYPFLYQAGGRPLSEDGSQPTFNSEAGVEALAFIVEMFENKWASQQYLQPIEAGQDPFTLGKQAISNQSFVNTVITLRKTVPDLKYAIGPVLSYKEQWGFGGRRSWGMAKTARNPEAAAAFLEFLTSPEIMVRHSEPFGVFPIKAQARQQVYKNDPEIAAVAERVPNIFGEQKHRYGRDLMPLVTPEIQAAILKQKTPKQALDDAAKAVSELFAKG